MRLHLKFNVLFTWLHYPLKCFNILNWKKRWNTIRHFFPWISVKAVFLFERKNVKTMSSKKATSRLVHSKNFTYIYYYNLKYFSQTFVRISFYVIVSPPLIKSKMRDLKFGTYTPEEPVKLLQNTLHLMKKIKIWFIPWLIAFCEAQCLS